MVEAPHRLSFILAAVVVEQVLLVEMQMLLILLLMLVETALHRLFLDHQ
jgi:hypothetical protein